MLIVDANRRHATVGKNDSVSRRVSKFYYSIFLGYLYERGEVRRLDPSMSDNQCPCVSVKKDVRLNACVVTFRSFTCADRLI